MTTIRDQLKSAIFGQESTSGRADTSLPNDSGARGPMQITKPTFDGLKVNGLIPSDWDWANPAQSKEAGNRLLDSYMDKYNDDPQKAAAAYYAGEKAVNANGQIVNYHDLKHPNAPDTYGYVNDVMTRMGLTADAAENGGGPTNGAADFGVIPKATDYSVKARELPPRPGHLATTLAITPTVGDNPLIVNDNGGEAATLPYAIAERNEQAIEQRRLDTSMLDSARAGYMHQGISGIMLRQIAENHDFPPQAGFDPRVQGKEFYQDKSEDEQTYLDSAQSHDQLAYANEMVMNRRADMETVAAGGGTQAFISQLVGGLPEGYLTGLGAAKAAWLASRAGMIPEVNQATRAARVAMSAGENLAGNVGSVAVQQQLDPYVGASDYPMAFGMSILGTVLHLPSIFGKDKAGLLQVADQMQKDGADQHNNLQSEATSNVGSDATEDTVKAEMGRIESKRIAQGIDANTAPLPETRQFPGRELFEGNPEDGTTPPANPETSSPADIAKAAEDAQNKTADETMNANGGLDRTQQVNDAMAKRADILKRWREAADARDQAAIGPDGQRDLSTDAYKAAAAKTVELGQEYKAHMNDDKSWGTEAPGEDAQADMEPAPQRESFASEAPRWDNQQGPHSEAARRTKYATNEATRKAFSDTTEGMTLDQADKLGPGVHVQPGLRDSALHSAAIKAIEWAHGKFLPDATIVLGKIGRESGENGRILSIGKVHAIGLGEHLGVNQSIRTALHEMGHAIFHQTAKDIPAKLLSLMQREHATFLDKLHAGDPTARLSRFHEGADSAINVEQGRLRQDPLKVNSYNSSFDEYTAEAYVRHIQDLAHEEGIDMPRGVIFQLKDMWERIKALYEGALKKGFLPKDEAFNEYFSRVMTGDLKEEPGTASIPTGEAHEVEFDPAMFDKDAAENLDTDPLARKYGFDLMPRTTVAQRARANMVHMMYATADNAKAVWNNIDATRLKVLTDNRLFNVASTDVTLLKSENPLARMVAAELLEDPTGASGRRSTASLAKYLAESKFLGNTLNDIQSLYTRWRGLNGGSALQDFFNGDHYRRFNLAIAEEIERRKMGMPPRQPNEHVNAAADSLEKAYERIRQAQIDTKTLGWAALPENSVGYMPHRMSPEKIRNMTNEQMRVLHAALVDQFVGRAGYDSTFAANLAAQYIEKVRTRGLGGYDTPIDIYHAGAGDVVEDALNSMGMQRDQIRAVLDKYLRGAANHTKSRLDLNLLTEHEGGFRLIDMFETDQTKLLRSQSGRVSGEVALARHGIMGKPGLALIRDALQFGESGKKATDRELGAFDQIAAEFLNAPFGDAGGPWLNRAMQANSLSRLGGMGFTQAAEYINAAAHIGVGHTLSAIGSFGRLRSEAIALAKGEHVNNGLLGSIEQFGGREFGAEAYKMNFPFAEESTQYGTFGKDTPNMADKLLRGGMALQGKLSFWRAIHASQQRGLAEQVVLKATRYIREGGNDVALRDMGITDSVAARLKADIDNIAPADAHGNTASFDITKAKDIGAAEEFVQAVHRGVGQMIQQSFIGETGKWAHSGLMRLMLQFRTFSLISVEKQWARQVGNHGTAAAFGILMGSMAAAAPIYMARTALAAMGRSDRDEYLERQLSPQMIARATLNYIAMSGLAGDFMDAFTTVSGVGGGGTGGRASAGQDFFGNTVAPAVGLVNDTYKAIQNTKSGTDPTALLRTLPFGRLPWLIPAINGLTPESASSTTGH